MNIRNIYPSGYEVRKRRSQHFAFGIFSLLSVLVVAILFAILGFIIYKGIGVISWDFLTESPTDGRYMAGDCRNILFDGRKCLVRISGWSDERYIHERIRS